MARHGRRYCRCLHSLWGNCVVHPATDGGNTLMRVCEYNMALLVWLQMTVQEFKNMTPSPDNVELLLKIITRLLVLLAGAWGWFVTRTVKRIDTLEKEVARISAQSEVEILKATNGIVERLAGIEAILKMMQDQMSKLNQVVYED